MRRIETQTGPAGLIAYYISPLLQDLGVRHAFSTRIGGVSTGVYASLNMGSPMGCAHPDTSENVAENHRILSMAADLPQDRVSCTQVHSNIVAHCHPGLPRPARSYQADSILSSDPAVAIVTRAADCAAVLISSQKGGLIAAVHAGWRGIINGAITNALAAFRERGVAPYAAAVFPCISMTHFEVGPEVVAQFRELFGPGAPARDTPDGKGRVGITESAVLQLGAAGIPHTRIDASDTCTYANAMDFFSHRRDRGNTGRMALLAVASGAPE